MTNLAETLQIDPKKVSPLLVACGMTEENHDLEGLKAVVAMRAEKKVKTNREGYCLYLAEQYQVDAQDIHKGLEPTRVKTSDEGYLELYASVCARVAGGESITDAVCAISNPTQDTPIDTQGEEAIPPELREFIDEKTTATVKATVLGSLKKLEGLQGQVESYVDHRIQVSMDGIMEDPDVKAATARLIEGTTPEKSHTLEASLVD